MRGDEGYVPIVPHTPWKENDDCTVLINNFFLKKSATFLVYKFWNYLENPTMDKLLFSLLFKEFFTTFPVAFILKPNESGSLKVSLGKTSIRIQPEFP